MGTISRLAGLAAMLATAGCVQQPAQWYQPPVSGLGPPVPLNALPPPPPVVLTRPLPERLPPSPSELPPLEEPSFAAPAQPPFSDGTPFSDGAPFPDELPTYAEPAPPPAVEPPRPVTRAAEPTPAVPMVGFRPMRSPGSRSY